jgi:CRP/FNR family transcriptional regulator, anaerobic regulatory protein
MTERLARRVGLTASERAFLDKLGARPAAFARGGLIQQAGLPAREAFVLISGWAMTFTDFADGSRQVRRLHFPGDLLAMPCVAMRHHVESIEALTDVVAAPFRKEMLATLISEHPRLTGMFFIFAQQERITYGDRLCALGRRSCKARMAFLLMDILTRLRAVDDEVTDTFEMHLTRAQMSEITGMTPVHASRMWTALIAEGAIACENGRVTIRNENRLIALSSFVDRSADLDFSWIPPDRGTHSERARIPGLAQAV